MFRNSTKKQYQEEEIFRDLPVRKAVLTMAVPTVIGQMIILIYNLADTFFIGRTGNPYMVAAASLILPVFNISAALSSVVGQGGGTQIARLIGLGERDEARRLSAFTFYTAMAVGLAWALLVFAFMRPLLLFLGASTETYEFARQYAFCVVVFCAVPSLLQLVCANLLRAAGYSKQAGFGVAMGGILNVALDPLFMFVLMPKGQEILGAGVATLLSNIVTLVYFLGVITRLRGRSVLDLSPLQGLPSGKTIRSMFQIGLPAGISVLLFDVSQMLINRLMAGYGDIPLAAVGIVLKAERIPLNTGIGICQGMIPIIAYNNAAKNHDRMVETVRFSRFCGLAVAAVSIVFYEIFAGHIMYAFINDAATAGLGAGFLRARCLATPFMFMAFHLMHSFQAMGEGRIATALALIRQLVFYIPLLFLMNAVFGMYGLVWTQLIGDICTDIVSFIWFRKKVLSAGGHSE